MFLFCFQYTLMTKHCRWKPVGKKTEFSMKSRSLSPCYYTRAHLYTVAGAVRPAGGVAYFVRDGKLRSPNPLCALRSQTPALRLSGSTEPVIPSLKGGVPHRFLSYPRQYYQAQRRPFCCCRSCLPQRNQADK